MSKYDNFNYFNGHLCLDLPALDRLLVDLKEPLKEHVGIQSWSARYDVHLRLLFINLLHTYNLDPERYIAYSRDRNYYADYNKMPSRYRCTDLRLDSMVLFIDALRHKSFGFIEGKIGNHDKNTNKGEMSRMRATSKLIDLLTTIYVIPASEINENPDLDVIVMRDKEKVVITRGKKKGKIKDRKFNIDYIDTPETHRMRANLHRINNLIDQHFIGLAVTDHVLKVMTTKMVSRAQREKGKARNIDFSKTINRRKFNNNSWEQGGRFYNGWWQSVPSAYRKYIRIDNVSTVEVDFSSLHFMLLYLDGLL